jgi:hypothetical protein
MAAKKLNYRLPVMTEETLDADQRALLESMRAAAGYGSAVRSAFTCWRRNTAS